MKKATFLLTFLLILSLLLSGCGNTTEDTNEDSSTKTKTTVKETEESTTKKATTTTTTKKEDTSWQDAYTEYIKDYVKENETDGKYGPDYEFYFIDVNGDEIPELLCNWGTLASGSEILTCSNGKVDSAYTEFDNATYLEKGNRIIASGGHAGFYFDAVYKIENGKWVALGEGENGFSNGLNEEDGIDYTWNDKTVSQKEYNAALLKAFGKDAGVRVDSETALNYSTALGMLASGNITYADTVTNEVRER